MADTEVGRLYRLYADILDYPGDGLIAHARECVGRLSGHSPEAAREMQAFLSFVLKESPGRMEEIYTRTFDITPVTTLYLSYHLFGESYQRGAFLVRLREAYRDHGFSSGAELADHLCILLRFIGIVDDPEFVHPLLEECILPTLEKIEEALSKNEYGPAISSLRFFLQEEHRKFRRFAA